MPNDNNAQAGRDIGTIFEIIRRFAQAIAEGRIEAAQVAQMTDEQLDAYNERLTSLLEEAVDEARKSLESNEPPIIE
jgi:hypothetical protein